MTVIGFAQQSYYFDLLRSGALQSLTLTFALIGGLIILLMPGAQKITTISAYLALIFIVIIGPTPSNSSLFFYPLGATPEKWNCPVSVSGVINYERMCRQGRDEGLASQAGTISDALSGYAQEQGFSAFLPQLAAVHFFTAIERTMLNALWGNAENQTRPGDMVYEPRAVSNSAAAIETNSDINYYVSVYNSICQQFPEALESSDLTTMPKDQIIAMAERYFTFSDAIIANEIYYAGFQNTLVYPARAATARLSDDPSRRVFDQAKSMNLYEDSSFNPRTHVLKEQIDRALEEIDTSGIKDALVELKTIRKQLINVENVTFPTSRDLASGRTHIFKGLTKNDEDYMYDATRFLGVTVSFLSNYRDFEPDPYDHKLVDGTLTLNENFLRSQYQNIYWSDADFSRKPATEDEFQTLLQPLRDVSLESDPETRRLVAAMLAYPVQLLFPMQHEDGYINSGLPDTLIDTKRNGLTARTLGTKNSSSLVGIFAGNIQSSVQSCLDLAAMIDNRRWTVLRAEGYIRPGYDMNLPLSTSQLRTLRNDIRSDTKYQEFDEEMSFFADLTLKKWGVDPTDPADAIIEANDTKVTRAVKEFACDISGVACKALWGGTQYIYKSFQNGKQIFYGSQNGGNDGLTGRALYHNNSGINFNAASAGIAQALVPIGIKVVSIIQGFVYGAYMKIFPLIISYGIAITLFVTPFVFLLGIAVPLQASAVLIAPIVAIAYLKTVSITLILLDHVFVYLMFWVESTNISDAMFYKSGLILAHLMASTMLFALTGMLLFGMKDSGSFVKQFTSMDNVGKISFNEAMTMAAPAVGAAIATKKLATSASAGRGRMVGAATERGQNRAVSEGDFGKARELGNTLANRTEFWSHPVTNAVTLGLGSKFANGIMEGYEKSPDERNKLESFTAVQRVLGRHPRSENDPYRKLESQLNADFDERFKAMADSNQVPSQAGKGLVQHANAERALGSMTGEVRDAIKKSMKQAVGSIDAAAPQMANAFENLLKDMQARTVDGKLDKNHYLTENNLETGKAGHYISQDVAKEMGISDEYIAKKGGYRDKQIEQSDGTVKTVKMFELDAREGLRNEKPSQQPSNPKDWQTPL